MKLGVVVTDINNKIIFVNHAITRMTGYDEQELLNKDLEILYPESVNLLLKSVNFNIKINGLTVELISPLR